MNRSEYWVWVAGMFFAGMGVGYFTNSPDFEAIFLAASVVFMWVIGYRRMNDTRFSNAWCIFAPVVLGTIVIGLLPSHDKGAVGELIS